MSPAVTAGVGAALCAACEEQQQSTYGAAGAGHVAPVIDGFSLDAMSRFILSAPLDKLICLSLGLLVACLSQP